MHEVGFDVAQDLIIEEYLDDEATMSLIEDDQDKIECIVIPSFKDLPDTSNQDEIIKLIDEIEEKNQLILEYSKPQIRIKERRKLKADPKEKQTQNAKNLIFENLNPKLMLPTVFPNFDGCKGKYSSELKLQPHLSNPIECFYADNKKHQPVLIECAECGKKLKSKKTYLVHKKTAHTNADRRFKCSLCTKDFNFKVHLENHERTHSGEKPFQCSQCNASFKQSYQLSVHSRKHNRDDLHKVS